MLTQAKAHLRKGRIAAKLIEAIKKATGCEPRHPRKRPLRDNSQELAS